MAFGPYELQVTERVLLKDGVPVPVRTRVMDLLLVLVERAGDLLSREQLESLVWPQAEVEETSVRVHILALRRTLGDGVAGARYITNVPGRGYCFVAPVTRVAPSAPAGLSAAGAGSGPVAYGPLPMRLSSVIGRDDTVLLLTEQVASRRIITVLGPGGIGKTAIALAVASRERARRSVCFVDLSLVADPSAVPTAVAAAFGITDFPEESLLAVARHVGHRSVLLVLDNCEHVLDAVADAITALLANAHGMRVLATSREAIGMASEWLHRLKTLEVPLFLEGATAQEALQFSAVQLFVERARASTESFQLSDEGARLVGALCRRLDGMPLAIEIAAARVHQFGLQGLAAQLDNGFLRLRRNRRNAHPRHEALVAMLDWSHCLLSPIEQAVLRRVAVFRSPFQATSAIRVATGGEVSESDVVNALASLRAKSLLNRVVLGDMVKHQLLEQTRLYALEKLCQSDDEEGVRRRHAGLVVDLLAEAQRNWPLMQKGQWMALHGTLLPAIHTATKWAFSETGDALIGASLMSVSWPMAHYLFLDDCESNIGRAIDALERMADPPTDLLIRLHVGRALQVQERKGTGIESRAAYDKALEISRLSADPLQHIEAQIGIVLDAMGSAESARAVAAAMQLKALAGASGDDVAFVVAHRLAAQALHLNGEHAEAHALALEVRRHAVHRAPLASLAGVVDHKVSMGVLVARTHWLQGRPDQAMVAALETLTAAEGDSSLALCQALALAVCPIALWRGDDRSTAAVWVDRLMTQARGAAAGQWLPLAEGYRDILDARAVPIRPGPAGGSHAGPVAARGFPFAEDQLSAIDGRHWRDSNLRRADQGDSRWCTAEVWRLHGHRLLARGDVALATQAIERALDLAQHQHAHAWSLRCAVSLAGLWQADGRDLQARDLLRTVLGRFTEGQGTSDRLAAVALLDAPGGRGPGTEP